SSSPTKRRDTQLTSPRYNPTTPTLTPCCFIQLSVIRRPHFNSANKAGQSANVGESTRQHSNLNIKAHLSRGTAFENIQNQNQQYLP
ncbi:hypothetical protein J6590_097416, partial [Homalodisca vitripennis]